MNLTLPTPARVIADRRLVDVALNNLQRTYDTMKTDKELADELDARKRIESHGGTWVKCKYCKGVGYTHPVPCLPCRGRGGKWEFPMTR